MAHTTREEALNALRLVRRTYGEYGYRVGSPMEKKLLDILTTPPSKDSQEERAEEFRLALESIHGNIRTARTITYEVFGSLGRLGETTPVWI